MAIFIFYEEYFFRE
ncbi:hypothetical protein Q0P57_13970 [Staphylococcus aureus]|nr:hypothetical protein [Staphylococcus aureus]